MSLKHWREVAVPHEDDGKSPVVIGLGRRLLQASVVKAWRHGLTRIELEARADNRAAIALYEKFGFRHEAQKHQAMRFGGQYADAVQLSLLRA